MMSCGPRRGHQLPSRTPFELACKLPCVPARRLRISLSAAHSTEDVEALVAALGRCGLALLPQAQAAAAPQQPQLLELNDKEPVGGAASGAVLVQAASANGMESQQQALRARL